MRHLLREADGLDQTQPAEQRVQVTRYRTTVPDELGDYNGHLNVSGYARIFDDATAVYLNAIGVGAPYARAENASTFVLELHVKHLREIHCGAEIEVETIYIGHDHKRMHYLHLMRRLGETEVAAAQEQLSIHVSLESRRSSPWPQAAVARMGPSLGVDPAYISGSILLRPKG